jgi:hypothetical protein
LAASTSRERQREVKFLEEDERRRVSYEKAKAESKLLAQELKTKYAGIQAWLGELIAKIEANDRQIDYINSQALPRGAEHLRSAELIARDLESWRVNQTEVVRITRELVLPAFKHDPHRPYAWPRLR